jgi:hypothetical protein
VTIAAVYGADSGAAGSATTLTRSATYSAGDTIQVWVKYASSSITVTVSDGTHAFTQVGGYVSDGSTRRVALFEAHNVAAGTFTITATFSSTVANRSMAYVRCTGASTGVGAQTGAGQFQASPGAGANAVTTGNMTPTSQPNAVVAFDITTTSGATISAGTGYTSLGAIASYNSLQGDTSLVEWKRTTSTAAVAGTFSYSVDDAAYPIAGVFSEAAAGGGGSTVPPLLPLLGCGRAPGHEPPPGVRRRVPAWGEPVASLGAA